MRKTLVVRKAKTGGLTSLHYVRIVEVARLSCREESCLSHLYLFVVVYIILLCKSHRCINAGSLIMLLTILDKLIYIIQSNHLLSEKKDVEENKDNSS